MQGIIKRIVRDKLFGFIRDERTGTEYFFHKSGCRREDTFDGLSEGQRVSFDAEDSAKGPRAGSVEAL